MAYGAAVLAAKEGGAAELVDPRPFAVGSIKETFAKYPHITQLLPAMGYGRKQMEELRETIARSDADLVLIGTPIDLRRVIELDKPALRVTYRLEEIGEPTIAQLLAERGIIDAAGTRDLCVGFAVLTVVALGGNALLRPGERGTAAEQRANLAATFEAAGAILRDGPVVVTHGNGPQVGNELLRQELAAPRRRPLPLYLAVAQTQAEIGALVAAELEPVAGRRVAVVLTRVVVDEDDPAFDEPDEADRPVLRRGACARVSSASAAGRFTRTPVAAGGASCPRRAARGPRARRDQDAARGGSARGGRRRRRHSGRRRGRPPRRRRRGHRQGPRLRAPRDRPRRRAPRDPHAGAAVYAGFGTTSRGARRATCPAATRLHPERFPAGSMRPKVEAAFRFVVETGGEALITSSDALAAESPARGSCSAP